MILFYRKIDSLNENYFGKIKQNVRDRTVMLNKIFCCKMCINVKYVNIMNK